MNLLVRFRVVNIGKALLSKQDLSRADGGSAYLVRKASGCTCFTKSGSRRLLQQVVKFVQVTVVNGNRWNRGLSSTGTILMHSATSDATLATPGSEHCMPTGRVLFSVFCCWSCRRHKLFHKFSTSSGTAGPLLPELPPSSTGHTPALCSIDITSRNSSLSVYGNSL